MNDQSATDLPVTEIVLSRGDAGLGFNIRGGVDNPHIPGDTGVFVTKVRDNGAAHADGRLKEGDKILAINDKSLNGVTHEEAVQCFTQAKDTVKIQVQHGAQADILQRRMKEKEAKAENEKKNKPKSSAPYYIAVLGVAVVVGVVVYFRRYKR